MRITLNELEATLRKAAVGAGWPYGLADEVGKAGVWMMRRGFNAVDEFLPVLASPGDASCRQTGDAITLTGPIIATAPCAADLLLAGSKSIRIAAAPANLVFGFLGAAANLHDCAFAANFGDGCTATIGPRALRLTGDPADHDAVAVSRLNTQVQHTADAAACPISAVSWAALQSLAAQSFVTATAASRLSGAGAGLTDND